MAMTKNCIHRDGNLSQDYYTRLLTMPCVNTKLVRSPLHKLVETMSEYACYHTPIYVNTWGYQDNYADRSATYGLDKKGVKVTSDGKTVFLKLGDRINRSSSMEEATTLLTLNELWDTIYRADVKDYADIYIVNYLPEPCCLDFKISVGTYPESYMTSVFLSTRNVAVTSFEEYQKLFGDVGYFEIVKGTDTYKQTRPHFLVPEGEENKWTQLLQCLNC